MAAVIGFIGLFAILTFGMRATALSAVYGIVPAEFPVVSMPPDDPGFHSFKETPIAEVTKFTPAIVLTADAFFFGDLTAFTTNFSDTRDKFLIRHVDGEPQLQLLVDTMSAWVEDRVKAENVPINKVLVFVPTGDIPMPIVIQVMAGLRKSPHFERVILGSGIF